MGPVWVPNIHLTGNSKMPGNNTHSGTQSTPSFPQEGRELKLLNPKKGGWEIYVSLKAAAQGLNFRVPISPLPVMLSIAFELDTIFQTPYACVLAHLTIFEVQNIYKLAHSIESRCVVN